MTISACRSAGERAYSGEGLVGFAWAFLRAGSRRVVAGLWDVDDRSTATLMDRFYEGIAAGEPPARALRDAKLALMKSERQLRQAVLLGGVSDVYGDSVGNRERGTENGEREQGTGQMNRERGLGRDRLGGAKPISLS